MNNRVVKMTGQPVSSVMENILERLANGEHVEVSEINNTPEIILARSHINYNRPTIELAGREQEQAYIAEILLQRGSANGVDERGKTLYNGVVEQGGRLDIVIGLPASGKSSVIVDSLSEQFHSRIIDNDAAKEKIPEYNHGWGASVVHEESKIIEKRIIDKALKNHDNIVYPKVGGKYKDMRDVIEKAKSYGYRVNLHYVELDREVALGRMINRFIDNGRFLPLEVVDKYYDDDGNNKIQMNYERFKKEGMIDEFSKWNNNVEKGKSAILVESSPKADFTDRHRMVGERRTTESRLDNRRNGYSTDVRFASDGRTGEKSGFYGDGRRMVQSGKPADNTVNTTFSPAPGSDEKGASDSLNPSFKNKLHHKNKR
ncbi:MAG: hypothetical protein E7222_13155 [Clostridiales bacterium]|nr:hypothetical protein [Clostridiales bacterium]